MRTFKKIKANVYNRDGDFPPSFKFLSMWTLHNDCRSLIENCWQENVVGCPMHILSTKLKYLKAKLKIWNTKVFGNVHECVDKIETHLNHIQHQIQISDRSDTLFNLAKVVHVQLEVALKKQNLLWQEKAGVSWHVDGDRNTKYFHKITEIKNKTKLISHIRSNNELIIDPSLIADHIVSYYKCLFSTNIVFHDNLLVEEVIP